MSDVIVEKDLESLALKLDTAIMKSSKLIDNLVSIKIIYSGLNKEEEETLWAEED